MLEHPHLVLRLFVRKDDNEEKDVGEDGGDAVDKHDQPDGCVPLMGLHVVHPW